MYARELCGESLHGLMDQSRFHHTIARENKNNRANSCKLQRQTSYIVRGSLSLCAPLFPSKFMSHGKHRKSIFQRICEPLNASIHTERRVLILFARFSERHWKLAKIFQRLYVQHETRLIADEIETKYLKHLERIPNISILIIHQSIFCIVSEIFDERRI